MVTWQYNYNNSKHQRAATEAEAVAKGGQKAAVKC